eukprot:10136002-Lingulodinium_polyedra.AAC.1
MAPGTTASVLANRLCTAPAQLCNLMERLLWPGVQGPGKACLHGLEQGTCQTPGAEETRL